MKTICSRDEERTGFQTPNYHPSIDLRTDAVFVYGWNETLPERLRAYRERGYRVHFMTGIAWGGYAEYLDGRFDGETHSEEAQMARNGERITHGGSTFYIVPSPSYVAFFKRLIERVIDAGVDAIHLEEPEFWSRGGYSPSFQRLWREHYGEDWQPPHSSPAAWYKAAQLKYRLYTDCLEAVFDHAKRYGRQQGRTIRCFVDSHSLVNYAQWGIVSPESNLAHLPSCDGYVCQVWTGTARTPNHYRGRRAERTFLTAYLEYAQMAAMVLATGRKVWFLADPIEDDPRYDWEDYRRNYHWTLVASLLHPEVNNFEVMPWPDRVFNRTYPSHLPKEQQSPISPAYAAELMTLCHALAQMPGTSDSQVAGTGGIGVCIADSLLFERGFDEPEQAVLRKPGDPSPPDQIYRLREGAQPELDSFYGLALPLLQRGLPIRLAHLEHAGLAGYLASFRLLILSYDAMKPPSAETHAALAQWVRAGGVLLVVGDAEVLPFDMVDDWWRRLEPPVDKPAAHLWQLLGGEPAAATGVQPVGMGAAAYLRLPAARLARDPAAEEVYLDAVRGAQGAKYKPIEQTHLLVRRGAYLAACALTESPLGRNDLPLKGDFIDLFDPALPAQRDPVLHPGDAGLFYDLARSPDAPAVIAAAGRIEQSEWDESGGEIVAACPAHVDGLLLCRLAARPAEVTVDGAISTAWTWDQDRALARIPYAGNPMGARISIH
jgi:hypothetical protein